jgi:hypothetical protein
MTLLINSCCLIFIYKIDLEEKEIHQKNLRIKLLHVELGFVRFPP